VRRALEGFGVDTRWVGTDPVLRTPIVFCELHPPDRFPLLFCREPKAPDLNIAPEELDRDGIAYAALVWTTGIGLCQEPSRSATLAALEGVLGLCCCGATSPKKSLGVRIINTCTGSRAAVANG
jgi:5-dehydro-2-deoxygluconokinase